MAQGILVISEQRGGAFRKVTYEVISEGRRLADNLNTDVTAVVLGARIESIAQELGKYGADTVLVADNPALSDYTTDAYTNVLADIIKSRELEVIILGASFQGKDLALRLAARLDAALAMECIAIRQEDGTLIITRPMFGGKVLADVELMGYPKMVAVRPNVMSIAETIKAGSIENIDMQIGEVKTAVLETKIEAGDKIELTKADVIVSGGRGTGGDFAVIEELAGLLKAAVGASRTVVDEGWRPHGDQVGQTGKIVSPNLYVACGISGAIQHIAGMSTSKYIVAVNKDPEAPIFSKADFGVVGDLFQVVPAIAQEMKKVLE